MSITSEQAAGAEKALCKLATLYENQDWDSIVAESDEVLKHADIIGATIGNTVSASHMYSIVASANTNTANPHLALQQFMKAKTLLDGIAPNCHTYSSYDNVVLSLMKLNRYAEALVLCRKAFALSNTQKEMHKSMHCIGICEECTGNQENAIECYDMALKTATEMKDDTKIVSSLMSTASCRFYMLEYDAALSLFERVAEMTSGPLHEHRPGCPPVLCTSAVPAVLLGMGAVKWAQWRAAERPSSQLLTNALDLMDDALVRGVESQSMSMRDLRATLLRLAFANADYKNETEALSCLQKMLELYLHDAADECFQCMQARSVDKDDTMLTCGGCLVARFCNVECQQHASSKKGPRCGNHIVRHKELCPLLREWHKQNIGRMTVDECVPLQRKFLLGPAYGPGARAHA